MEKKSKHFKTTIYILTRKIKTQRYGEEGRTKFSVMFFVSFIESKLHPNLSESAMYIPHPLSISPNAVILYDHGTFVTTKKPVWLHRASLPSRNG